MRVLEDGALGLMRVSRLVGAVLRMACLAVGRAAGGGRSREHLELMIYEVLDARQ